ncbi:hypothetical protein LWC34_44945 [Kibdelosporangium philippinense]|uniref:TrbL/VirB6 plasmid conjugal transfer protein n=1 Tax=Kibdelosporangium philippinense TaxID=211113 RepID=A0ABS8ZQ93_9PSEU|nr:hypothetical protein [Kibdelosporangium philippinense]MCE7009906.1 hypothetical protein [Kibdelosporangium philippinense]
MSLTVLCGAALAVNAGAAPLGPVHAQPLPTPPPSSSTSTPNLPIPTGPPTSVTCFPGSLQYECLNQTTTTPRPPCTGEGCIPQPPSSPPPSGPGSGQPVPPGEQEDDCGLTNIGACITEAINDFFRTLVEAALNPLLDLLGRTLLTTPTPDSLPRVGELWHNSWDILLVSYGLLVMIGGVLIMSYQTLQARYTVKEIAPRLVVGFVAGALSLWVATKAIQIANGLSQAVLGDGMDPARASKALTELVLGSLTNGGMWLVFIGLVVAVMLVLLLITYIVRVAITIILIAGAPLALMGHALPQTEGIAQWWWKVFGGCLAIQVGQSLALVAAINVFFTPGGFTLFGPTVSGLVNLLIVLALLFILFKIPYWFLSPMRSGGRSLLSSLVRGFIAYKTFGLLGRMSRGHGGSAQPRRLAPSAPNGGSDGKAWSQPLPWWSWRRRRAAKWIRPDANMLPLKLRRGASAVGQPRHTLADELHDPGRDTPGQRPTPADHPDLFGPEGQVRRHARPVRVDRPLIPPTPGMLPLRLRSSAPGTTRSTLADELANPHRAHPGSAPMPPHSPGLVTRHGHVNPAARPPHVRHPLIPPEPGMLPMYVRHADPITPRTTVGDEFDARPTGYPPSPPTAPGLFMRDGRPNRRATPPKKKPHTPPRRRASPPSGPLPPPPKPGGKP